VDDGNKSDGSASQFSDFGDSGSSVEWTEESSDENLDYFAALDVAAAEASPHAADAEAVPGPSTRRRRRRAVAKRRVSGADGGLAVAELPELFQLKFLSPALEARPHLNGNNPSIPRI
jgi:hypothetical protein